MDVTGTILHGGASDTKLYGVITGDDGKEYTYEEPHDHLDGTDRPWENGARVKFQVHLKFPTKAFNVTAA